MFYYLKIPSSGDIVSTTFKIAFLVLSALTAFAVHAAQPITGAFGIELGKKLNATYIDGSYSGTPKLGGEFIEVTVNPPSPNELFHAYTATIDASRKSVVQVEASGMIDGKKECMSKLESLGKYLVRKYGGELKIEKRGGAFDLKTYFFLVDPPTSRAFIAAACSETDTVDNGWYERGFFAGDDETTYFITMNYNIPSRFLSGYRN